MKELIPQNANAKILLIDDDITNNLLIKNILTNHGYKQIKCITDPRIAANIYPEYEPDLILLDVEMPYMNGFEVFHKLKKLIKKEILPIIMVTVKSDIKNKNRALGLGIQYFLEKPVNKIELLARVHSILHFNWIYSQTAQRNKSIEEKLNSKEKEFNEAENSIIQSLLLSVKFRDQETGVHINRVSDIVYILAKGMGLSDRLSESLAKASKLHDIGKIGIPDDILRKEGKLNAEEWELMKDHTLIGKNILSSSNLKTMRLASVITATHHENWDGTGYPYALSGKRIPLAGRLTAIADVFDALLSDRPYKKAWDIDSAINYIKEESEKKFDPEIVKIFMQNIKNLKQLYETTAYINISFAKTHDQPN